jgi:phosphatidylserine/phosphatidylglycerophosphate/cardiolipin synthase-like enzyme
MGYQEVIMRIYRTFAAVLCVAALAAPAFAAFPMPDGASYETAFSPYGDGQELVLSFIREAKKSIRIAAYAFTSEPVAKALVLAHEGGVDVRVVADKRGNSPRNVAVSYLAARKVPIRLNGNYPIHHHNFMVVDGAGLKTGSFSFYRNAVRRHAGGVLVLRGVPELAARYADEWDRLWAESEGVR